MAPIRRWISENLRRLRGHSRRLPAEPRDRALCVLPWIHFHARTDGAVLPCCVADETAAFGSLHKDTVAEAFNSAPLRRLRLSMLSGVRPPACRRCYAIDDAGGRSLRQIFNHELSEHAGHVKETAADGSVDPRRIIYLDIRFSNLCNMRCRSCGSHSSTAWYQDDPSSAPKDFSILRPTADPAKLWAEIDQLLPRVEKLHFAGGEPMMMDETYQTLEKLLKLRRTDVALSYNTNASTWSHRHWDAVELWKHFPKVHVMASMDGSGRRGEYIRRGMRWPKVLDNCLRLRREAPHIRFQVNFTLGLLNALHLPDFFDEARAQGLIAADELALNFIQEPVYLSLTSLPERLKDEVRRLYERRIEELGRSGPELMMGYRLREALAYMRSRDTSSELGEFRQRTRALDEQRREDFAAVFPELAELTASS